MKEKTLRLSKKQKERVENLNDAASAMYDEALKCGFEHKQIFMLTFTSMTILAPTVADELLAIMFQDLRDAGSEVAASIEAEHGPLPVRNRAAA